MTSTRPHLRRRRLIGSALAAAVLFAGAMSACSPNPAQLQQVESTALSASQVKERISKTPTSTDSDSIPVGEDFLHVSAQELTEKEKAQRDRRDRSGANSSIVARYRGADGSVLWAREIKPAVVNWLDDDGSSAQDVAHDLLAWRPAGYAVVSPDGRYVSLVLRPPQMRPVLHDSDDDHNPLDVAAQRTHVLVLDAATGETVRTVEVSGLVLGQVLTNDALAVETARTYYPAGDGKGTVTVYSLTDTSAAPASFATDQWLTGIDDGALLLSPQSPATGWRSEMPVTLTRVDTRGRKLGTIEGVTAPDLKHWERPKQR
ncbi:hypothetical protein BKH23_10900 [Actinomyces oris]|uniref:hypothetical protein n=1 Tax=Actinomyces TaxID=1654 RepID=UPI00094D9ABC|nr:MULTISPECIES: hypothetical protein [Actinomyces]OLO59620.1 hypothetical protein BKH23_10900 [Actinomyces oris]OLO67612.1 hypothetical protein BKH21_06100 [Actinomyces oris]